MKFVSTKLSGMVLIEPKVLGDQRGYFLEAYKEQAFKDNGISENFVQDNMSSSAAGILRGLHYQLNPFAQGKLVRVIRGAIFDVGVDLRKDSQTFGEWQGFELSAENKHALYIPPGFAHGFCVLSSDGAEVTYKCTNVYSQEHDRSIAWNDPDIAVDWPIEPQKELLSQKDLSAPLFKDAEINF